MKMFFIKAFLYFLPGIFIWNANVFGQTYDEQPVTRILFLLDASGSMLNDWEDNRTKMGAAKKILREISDSIDTYPNVEQALRVYGHQSSPFERDCTDSKLEVPFRTNNAPFIKDQLKYIRPKGITPIAYSLQKAATDFPSITGRNIIIIMTDGDESCGGDPCEVALQLEQQNIILKHFVIGMNVTNKASKTFGCLGTFYNAKDPITLRSILNKLITRVLSVTTTQVDLFDVNKRPIETDVLLTFIDNFSDNIRHNYYHTLNPRGLPDTMIIDPLNVYNIKAHTLPPVEVENIYLQAKEHNTISINTPQGILDIQVEEALGNRSLKQEIKCIISSIKDGSIVNIQETGMKQKYLVGTYQLEALTLPRILLAEIHISQNKSTTIKIQAAGFANIYKKYEVYGSIFTYNLGGLKKIYELKPRNTVESVVLQPGKYIIIYRPKYSHNMHNTFEKEFEIHSGKSLTINL